MTIRVTSQIVKADPSDTYHIVDISDVKGGQEISDEAKAATATANNASQVANEAKSALDQVNADLQVVQSNIDQKPDGIHIEDRHGNAFDDISALNFASLNVTITNVQQKNANITIDNLVSVSNGQESDSVSMVAKAIEFPDAKITMRDPDGAKVAVIEVSQPAPSDTGITVDDGKTNVAGVKTINFKNATIIDDGSNSVSVAGYIFVGQQGGGTDDVMAQKIVAQYPLQAIDGKDGTAILAFDPAALGTEHVSYYAYLDQEKEIVPARKGAEVASLWFDSPVVSHSEYIEIDRINKLIGLQETDNLDPNITGGSDFLVILRVAMRGESAETGTVKVYIEEFNQLKEPVGILEDENGELCGVERVYKAGEALGVLEVVRVVKAKNLKYLGFKIVNPFDDPILISDRTEGNSCVVIQEISSAQRTGLGFLQYENDTLQSLPFTRHYLGQDHATLQSVMRNQGDVPLESGAAGLGYTIADGWGIYNRTAIKLGIESGNILIQSDGSQMADFSFHKIFNAEDTVLMHGKEEKVTVTVSDKQSGYLLLGMKWTGKPDRATADILSGRNNNSPVFFANWQEFDRVLIPENISTDTTVSKTFTIPTDAVQYAYALIPVAEQNPLDLIVKSFVCDVVNPFTSHIVHRPVLLQDVMRKNDEFWEFVQDNQGLEDIRYTINDAWASSPVGILKKGDSTLKLDNTKMTIGGSNVSGGEGAIVFPFAGKATMSVTFLVLNEQGTDSDFSARLVKVAESGAITPVANSEFTVKIAAGSKGSTVVMKADTFDVEAGDCVGIQMKSDKVDGCFLQTTSPSRPLVKTVVEYKWIS